MKTTLNQTKKELQKFKKEEEKLTNKKLKLEAEINLNEKDYQQKLDKLKKEYQEALEFESGFEPSMRRDVTADFQPRLDELNANSSYVKANNELKEIENQLKKNRKQQEEWNSKIDELNSKMPTNQSTEKISKSIDDVNNKMAGTIKRVAKWALAVFAVESAYGFVRNAISTLTGYNDQLAADVEYIQFAVASTLEPIIERLVGWVYKLLQYVNYLAQAWFNVNLFANASEKNFKKANSSAKQLNKSLSGFDEINQLSDNSGSGESYTSPSMDLSNMEDFEPPAWLEKFAKFGKPIIEFFQGIIDKYGPVAGGILIVAGALAAFKIIKTVINWFKDLGKTVTTARTDFTKLFNALGKAAEAIAILGGLSLVIDSITKLIDSFSESGMTLGEVAGLLGIVLGEVAVAFLAFMGIMTLMEPSWQSIAAAAVIFLGLSVVLQSVCNLIDTFSESGLSLTDVIGLMATVLITLVGLMGSIVALGPAMTAGMTPFSILIAEISAVLLVVAATLPIILDAVGSFIETVAPALCDILTTIGELIENLIYALGTTLPPIIESVGSLFNSIFSGISKVIDSVGNVLVKVLNAIGELVNSVLGSLLSFIYQLGPAVESLVDSIINSVTKLINFVISAIEYLVNLIIDGVNGIIKGVNSISKYIGITIPTVPEFKLRRFQPTYMETGGIIDVPRRGVALAPNVVGGEAGAEGVLPLTNSDTMRRLGREIGQWIEVDIQLNNYLNGRLIGKVVKQIQNGQEFSRNGG